jgi:DNA repair exonuclease SbcCD ATPase subunit
MEAGEEEDTIENVEEENVEEEEEEKEEESVQETTLEQLQSEVKELRGQLAELETEKEALMKKTRSLEDQQVKNWKWIQDATKFSGLFSFILNNVMCLINESLYLDCPYRNFGGKV